MDDDFVVDEIPAYSPSGEGPHCLFRIRKRDLTTREAVRRLARALGCRDRDMGYAGLKDRHAVTTQWISAPGVEPAAALGVSVEGLEVIEAHAHERKLRTGHLRGNRFVLRARDVSAEDRDRIPEARRCLERTGSVGLPNYFGVQRFGRGGGNAVEAAAWIRDGGAPPRDRFRRKLLASAWQSLLFNEHLDARLCAGALDGVEEGDLLRKEDTGGLFCSDEAASDAERARRWEVSATGPIFGPKMRWPEGRAAERERARLASHGMDEAGLARLKKSGPGTRRVVRVRPAELELEATEDGFRVAFTLPAGAYATVLLREILETPPEG